MHFFAKAKFYWLAIVHIMHKAFKCKGIIVKVSKTKETVLEREECMKIWVIKIEEERIEQV